MSAVLPREVGRAATVVRCQVATPRPPCRCIANVLLRWSAQTAPRRKRAAVRGPRGSRFDAAQWAKASPAVQSGWKAASKTAASVIARLNVSLAPPPRRSMCHTLANETPFHCKTTATASDDFSLDLPDRSDCLELTALQPILQMFTLGPLSRAGNVLTVPYPQTCSDSVLTAF